MLVVTDLGLQSGVVVVRRLCGNFLEHQCGQNLQRNIAFDEISELSELGLQLFLVRHVVNSADQVTQPLFGHVRVLWQPVTNLVGGGGHGVMVCWLL